MRVYRLECEKTGRGPFAFCVLAGNGGYRDWPLPRRDGIKQVPMGFLFGFHDWAHARHWFGDAAHVQSFRENPDGPFIVAVYDAIEVIKGGSQCVFNRETAKRIGQFDADALQIVCESELPLPEGI